MCKNYIIMVLTHPQTKTRHLLTSRTFIRSDRCNMCPSVSHSTNWYASEYVSSMPMIVMLQPVCVVWACCCPRLLITSNNTSHGGQSASNNSHQGTGNYMESFPGVSLNNNSYENVSSGALNSAKQSDRLVIHQHTVYKTNMQLTIKILTRTRTEEYNH